MNSIDLEDSIAAVDAEDKVLAYRNWHQIMRGTLSAKFHKNGEVITRTLNSDKTYVAANGNTATLRGRALQSMSPVQSWRHLVPQFFAVTDHSVLRSTSDVHCIPPTATGNTHGKDTSIKKNNASRKYFQKSVHEDHYLPV